ncbi:MAG: hypothetical protein SGPRY_002662 [Prymnesium sp.]
MYTQLSQLSTDSYRILNYTDLLINWQATAKGPKKRKSETEVTPLDNSMPLQWSDEVRRSFIDQRLKEATTSPLPPRCCKTWTSQLKKMAVVKLPQVINPFWFGHDEEHENAQRTSMHSIAHARALALAQGGIYVDVVCAMFEADVRPVGPEKYGFTLAVLNVSTSTALPQFRNQIKLPFLNQILYAGYLHGKGKYLVYSNIDIGVQPPFYIKLARQLQACCWLFCPTLRLALPPPSPLALFQA